MIQASFEVNFRGAQRWAPRVVAATREHQDEKEAASPAAKNSTAEANAPASDGVGIRKIRMGTFEDTGKCKGQASFYSDDL